jgi:hypothetical protein
MYYVSRPIAGFINFCPALFASLTADGRSTHATTTVTVTMIYLIMLIKLK